LLAFLTLLALRRLTFLTLTSLPLVSTLTLLALVSTLALLALHVLLTLAALTLLALAFLTLLALVFTLTLRGLLLIILFVKTFLILIAIFHGYFSLYRSRNQMRVIRAVLPQIRSSPRIESCGKRTFGCDAPLPTT
jgi:hypothetical protein